MDLNLSKFLMEISFETQWNSSHFIKNSFIWIFSSCHSYLNKKKYIKSINLFSKKNVQILNALSLLPKINTKIDCFSPKLSINNEYFYF